VATSHSDSTAILNHRSGLPVIRSVGVPKIHTTRYFDEQVLRKRPYLRREWCERVVAQPLHREIQADGRVRDWGAVPELGGRILRVVTLADERTIHNAFPDRNFQTPRPRDEATS
jgi:hypothetical protein